MAIFAPTFNDKNFDDIFVYNFYTYNNQLQSLVPLGMTFGNLLGETIGYPHPVILRISKAEFKTVKENYEFGIVDQLWNNIKKENPVVDQETGKTIWEYSIPIEGFLSIPSEYTESYDLIGDQESLSIIKDFIRLEIFGPQKGIVVGPDGNLEIGNIGYLGYDIKIISANNINFDSDNLLQTYCRYKNNNILNIGGNAEDIGIFFDCGTLLPFERFYLDIELVVAVRPLDLTVFSRQRLIINNKEINSKEPVPNCNKCFIWVVKCFEPCAGNEIIVKRMSDFDDLEDTSKRFFRSFEEANNWIETQGKTWVCCDASAEDEPFKEDVEYECLEISKFCADVVGFEKTYNSIEECEEECEEDCGKKWYCINNRCVRRFVDDPEVEALTPFDSETECLDSECEEPTPTPTPTEEPYDEESYDEEPYDEEDTSPDSDGPY